MNISLKLSDHCFLQRFLILISICILVLTAFSQAHAYQFVKTSSRQLLTDYDQNGVYTPFLIKGVTYNPTPIGRYPSDWGYPENSDPRIKNIYDDPAILIRDFELLKEMHVNVIRIYQGNNTKVTVEDVNNPLSVWHNQYESIGRNTSFITKQTLDLAQQYGIKVIAGFWMDQTGYWECTPQGSVYHQNIDYKNQQIRENIINKFAAYVTEFKDHPAILFWAIGNENNLSFGNDTTYISAFYSLINQMAQKAHDIEGSSRHPVALVNGDIQNINNVAWGTADSQMNALDIWGSNVYRGASFGTLFSEYKTKSQKPFWISEYGLDAWQTTDVNHPEVGAENQKLQASWDAKLWHEIMGNRDVSIGATVFDYSDQLWKPYEFLCGPDSFLCNSQQGYLGFGPRDNSCPADGIIDYYPAALDNYFNEEWFGIVGVSNNPAQYGPNLVNPRLLFYTMQKCFVPSRVFKGKVLDSENQTAISSAKVTLYGQRASDGQKILTQALTDAKGEFIFSNIYQPLNTYSLTVAYNRNSTQYRFNTTRVDNVYDAVEILGLRTSLVKPAIIGTRTIQGYVLVAGSRIPEAELILDQSNSEVGDLRGYTNESGYFIFRNLPAGIYSLRIRKLGYTFSTVVQIDVTNNSASMTILGQRSL